MKSDSIISKTELARQTHQILKRVRQESPLIVASYGQEEAAILDILDYRLLRAAASHLVRPPVPLNTSKHASNVEPYGLAEVEVKETVEKAQGDVQAAWDLVIGAVLDGNISLFKASELLGISRFDLLAGFHRHKIPLPAEPVTRDDLLQEIEVLLR